MPAPKSTQLPLFDSFPDADMANYMKTLRGPYSQTEFAGILGTDPSVVNNWEQAASRPSPRFLRAALEHYKNWAIQIDLPFTARQAVAAAGLKKHLTRQPDGGKDG